MGYSLIEQNLVPDKRTPDKKKWIMWLSLIF